MRWRRRVEPRDWIPQYPKKRVDYEELRKSFTRAVVRRMMTDVPWGVLLSGETLSRPFRGIR